MEVKILENRQAVAECAAAILTEQIRKKPDSVLGLPTGETPVATYHLLGEAGVDFSAVRTFNLDEYYPISPEDPQSYRYFMNQNLFSRINIPMENTHVPDGSAPDAEAVCREYESAIRAAGGIDLQVLGVGRNGHIGFNEPGTPFDGPTHPVTLTENTIDANARFFNSPDEVPTRALTMGIGTILRAKRILILITGREKHDALHRLLAGAPTTDCPVTALQSHPDVTVLCDRAAYDRFYLGVDVGGTELKLGVVNDFGQAVAVRRVATERASAEALLEQIAAQCSELLQAYPITAAGIGLPGIIDPKKGRVGACGNLPLAQTDIRKELERRLGIPFFVENDANCAALAEYAYGAGQGCDPMLLVTIGTGIGGGLLLHGTLYHGRSGGGELGHLITHADGLDCPCGQKGCFEQYASAAALRRAVTQAAAQHPESRLAALCADAEPTVAVFDGAEEGCPLCKEILERYYKELSHGLKSLLQIFDPAALVLAGGITGQGDRFLQPLLSRLPDGVPLRLAKLGNRAGVVGAALLAITGGGDHAL